LGDSVKEISVPGRGYIRWPCNSCPVQRFFHSVVATCSTSLLDTQSHDCSEDAVSQALYQNIKRFEF
jgi:hypothetical protein